MIGVYMNTQLTYMLEDKDMFNIEQDQIGRVASRLTIYSLPFSIAMTFCSSYIFEILGRKKTIFFSFFFTAIVLAIFPYTAPNYNLLILIRIAIGVTMSGLLAHPLIADYIQKKTRGKGIALSGLGIILGEVLAMGVLFNYTKDMTYEKAFFVASLMTFGFAFFHLVAVKDPDMKKLRTNIDMKLLKSDNLDIDDKKDFET
jgi:MFS family permease